MVNHVGPAIELSCGRHGHPTPGSGPRPKSIPSYHRSVKPRSVFLLALVLPWLTLACAGGRTVSAEDKETRQQMSDLKAVLNPSVWLEVQKQSWYRGGVGSADGVRL